MATETIHPSVTPARVMELAEADDCQGICLACGEPQDGCEPDARNYECEGCGEHRVCGAEEVLLTLF